MNSPRQFSLRTAIVAITVLAAALGCWNWHRWWSATRHVRGLDAAIQASDLSDLDKALLGSLARNPQAWRTGLIDKLVTYGNMERVVWASRITLDGRRCRIFLLDSLVKQTAGPMFPITCVVTTEQYDLLFWDQLADFSEGFVSATLAADGTLTITSFGNYFSGKHVHQYLVTGRGFLAKGSHILSTPAHKPALKLHRDSRQLRDTIKEVQRRDKSVEA